MKLHIVIALLAAPSLAASLLAQQSDKASNADLVTARAANKEQRYADAETLMLADTALAPNSRLMWMELGAARMGLKKYDEAELDFKKALGIDPATQVAMHSEDFYTTASTVPGAHAMHASRNVAEHSTPADQKLNPEIAGAAYGDLGEIYARTERTEKAQSSWDAAVKSNPAMSSFYRGNEAIIFYQVGSADAQVAAAGQAIAADPSRAMPYYFKGQGLASHAAVDPETQKLVLPPGCQDAYRKYLELEPHGKFSAEAKEMIAAVGK